MNNNFLSAVRIGFSSHVYEVTESMGSVSVQVVKNGSNDIAVSVLLNTTAETALGNCIHCARRKMISHIMKCLYGLNFLSWR